MFIIELLSMGIVYATITTGAIYIMKSYYDNDVGVKAESAESAESTDTSSEELEMEEELSVLDMEEND